MVKQDPGFLFEKKDTISIILWNAAVCTLPSYHSRYHPTLWGFLLFCKFFFVFFFLDRYQVVLNSKYEHFLSAFSQKLRQNVWNNLFHSHFVIVKKGNHKIETKEKNNRDITFFLLYDWNKQAGEFLKTESCISLKKHCDMFPHTRTNLRMYTLSHSLTWNLCAQHPILYILRVCWHMCISLTKWLQCGCVFCYRRTQQPAHRLTCCQAA